MVYYNSRFISDKEFSNLKDYDYHNPAVWYLAKSKQKKATFHVRRISPDCWVSIDSNGMIQHIKSAESWKDFTVIRQPDNLNCREVAPNSLQRELDEKYYKYLNEKKWKYYYAKCHSAKHNIQSGDEVFAKIDQEKLLLNKGFSFLSIPIIDQEKREILLLSTVNEATQKALNFKYHDHRFWSKAYLHDRYSHGFSASRVYVRRNIKGYRVIFDGKNNIKVIDPDEGICPYKISGKVPEWKDKEINETLIKKGLYQNTSTYDMSAEEV